MKRQNIFAGGIAFFLLAIFLATGWRDPHIFLSFFLLPGILIFPKVNWKIALVWSAAFALGILRVWSTFVPPGPENIAFYAREGDEASFVQIEGVVTGFPQPEGLQTKIFLAVTDLIPAEAKTPQPVSGKILVTVPAFPAVRYGDQLRIKGKLQIPPDDPDFSYRHYLEKEGVFAFVPQGTCTILTRNNGNPLQAFLFQLRADLEETLRTRLPEPVASFANGLLLGGEGGFPEEVLNEFRTTGLSHLLALSGFNITILIIFLFWLLQSLPKIWRISATFFLILAFVFLTGGSSSIVRAALMGSLNLVVLHSGQEASLQRILWWSIALMLLWNPFLLLADVSFQLSVAGVLGLMFFSPLWEKLFARVPGIFGFRDALQTTLAAQVVTAPLLVFYFGRLSLIAPLANMLIAPAVPLGMLLSFLTVLPIFGSLISFFTYGVLAVMLWLVHILSLLPWADTACHLGKLGLAVLYGLAAGAWWYFRSRAKSFSLSASV